SIADTNRGHLVSNCSRCWRSDNPLHPETRIAHRSNGPYDLPLYLRCSLHLEQSVEVQRNRHNTVIHHYRHYRGYSRNHDCNRKRAQPDAADVFAHVEDVFAHAQFLAAYESLVHVANHDCETIAR